MKEIYCFRVMLLKPNELTRRCKHIPDLTESWHLNNGSISRVRGPAPTVKKPDEVLVKVRAASINPLGKSSKQFMMDGEQIESSKLRAR